MIVLIELIQCNLIRNDLMIALIILVSLASTASSEDWRLEIWQLGLKIEDLNS